MSGSSGTAIHHHKSVSGGTHLQLLTKRLPLPAFTCKTCPDTLCTRPAKRTRQIDVQKIRQQQTRDVPPSRCCSTRRATCPQRSNRKPGSQAACLTASQRLVHYSLARSAAR